MYQHRGPGVKQLMCKKLYSSCIKNEQILWHWLVTREIDNDWLTSKVIVAWQSGIGRNTHTHIIGEQLSIIMKDWKIEWQADMESQIATTSPMKCL